MKQFVCAVYDVAAEAFLRPYFAPAIGLAMRTFEDECKREAHDNPLWNHPTDFGLYQLGIFDDVTGKFDQGETPTLLLQAKNVQRRNGNVQE